jgi:hypothetical protein
MTPNDLYNYNYHNDDVTYNISTLAGCYYTHIPELETELQRCSYGNIMLTQTRVSVKTVKYHSYDGRRIWHLATVWLDDKPVMVIQNAGREGDDHAARFVTDLDAYREMVAYLRSIIPIEWDETEVMDRMQDNPALTRFYDQSLDGYFEFWR